MKLINDAGLARHYAPAQRIAWLLELTDGDWTWRGATFETNLDGNAYPARLGEVTRWREWLPETGREGGRARASAELLIPDLPTSTDSLRAQLEVRAPVGIAATLRLAWLAAPNESLPAADSAAAIMLRGRLTAWRIEPAGVSLTLTDELEVIGARPIPRLLRAQMLASAASSSALGTPLPWIFGAVDNAPLVPLASGSLTELAAATTSSATLIPVLSLDGFPSSGIAQLGSELITYNDVDPIAKTLGRAGLSVARGTSATNAGKGTQIRSVPSGGFTWLAADHPCRAVTSVRADGMLLSPTTYTIQTTAIGGFDVQTITLQLWPLTETNKFAHALTARVEGLPDASDPSKLIENPSDVIAALLTHPRFGALDASRIDPISFSAVRAALAGRNYKFARRVAGSDSPNITLGALLDSAAEEAALWVGAGDPITLKQADPVPHATLISEIIDATRTLLPAGNATLTPPQNFIPPDAVELIGALQPSSQGRPTYLFPPERDSSGAIPRRYTMQWLDLTQQSAATDVGELLWRRLAEAPYTRKLSAPIGAALLSPGDTIRVDDAAIDMPQTEGWLRALDYSVPSEQSAADRERGRVARSSSSPARAILETWGPWAGAFIWRHDAENYIRRFAFGGHLLFVLNNEPTALLTRQGTLRLVGTASEASSLIVSAPTEPIQLIGGALYLSTGSSGPNTPFARLNSDGHFTLIGTIRERAAPSINPAGQSTAATSLTFWLSPDTQTTALEWHSDTQRLHLPGIVIESTRL